jgi:hypothetical protein
VGGGLTRVFFFSRQGTLTDIRTFAGGSLLGAPDPEEDTLPKAEYSTVTLPKVGVKSAVTAGAASGMPIFTVLKGVAAPLDIQNIDTDMIIPKDYLKTIKRTGTPTTPSPNPSTLHPTPYTLHPTPYTLRHKP